MAKRGGIGGYGKERFLQGLQDVGVPSRYGTALFPPPSPPVRREEDYFPEEEERAPRTLQELLDALDMNSDSFDSISTPGSSRVSHIEFDPDGDYMSVLEAAADAGNAGAALNGVTGTIFVGWQNGKQGWAYRNTTLRDFIKFKDAGKGGGSYGKYINSVMNSFSHGPA